MAFGQLYGVEGVDIEMIAAGLYTDLGDPPTLAGARIGYMPMLDRLAILVNVEATRLAAEGSRLSRQSKPSELKISQLIERVPAPAASPTTAESNAAAQPSAQRAEVARSETSSAPAATASEPQPTTPTREPTAQLARRTEESRPTPDAPAQPTLPRQLATPRVTPRTPVAMADTPSPSRETTPTEPTPANIATTRRTVDSPTTDRAAREPAVAAVTEPSRAPRERTSPAPADSPAIAATPSPVT